MILARLVLGLLNLAPMTGYDLKKVFDSSISHFWAADKAQIYRTLNTLVAEGYATVEVVPQANYPDRQEHHITPAGQAVLLEWLTSEPTPHAAREPFLARVFFAGNLPRAQVLDLLRERRAEAEAMLTRFTDKRESLRPAEADRARYLTIATLDNGIAHTKAELAWLDTVEQDLP
ncbi:PadR family transcriptional regulator [Pengzhenrongella frigida]|uniref:PadR family transcriptional regulator n=1 Tax=Pengzhenrongella frigida TaxID=1259133 RepID=A0A4Q5MYM9_9MICO|nr:PadR family transcriptional regulator [Cellulomonas sp. HLT2-17]RYV50805.1 PadR family transcriptional regulator [Cellulomonas sp. HLT2-17]